GVTATTEGGSREALEPPVASADHEVPAHGQRTVLHRAHGGDLAGLLVGCPVQSVIQQGAGRTTLDHETDLFWCGVVRTDPGSSVAVEDSRQSQDTFRGMNAQGDVEAHLDAGSAVRASPHGSSLHLLASWWIRCSTGVVPVAHRACSPTTTRVCAIGSRVA